MSVENVPVERSVVVDISSAPSFLPRRKAWADQQHIQVHNEPLQLGRDLEDRDKNLEKEARHNRARELGMYVIKGDKK